MVPQVAQTGHTVHEVSIPLPSPGTASGIYADNVDGLMYLATTYVPDPVKPSTAYLYSITESKQIREVLGPDVAAPPQACDASANQSRYGLAQATDGSVWYPMNATMCRLSSSGTVTPYPVSGGPSNFRFLIAAADRQNNVFLSYDSSTSGGIARFNGSTHAATFYPTPSLAPESLTAADDGTVWFLAASYTPSYHVVLGHLNPSSGTVTTVAVPNSVTLYYDASMTNGFNGHVYAPTAQAIVDIAPGGSITTYPYPGGCGACTNVPPVLTYGAFAELWFLGYKGLQTFDPAHHTFGPPLASPPATLLAEGNDGNEWTVGSSAINVYLTRVLTVYPHSVTLTVGESGTIKASETDHTGGYYATSSNPAVASVTASSSTGVFAIKGIGRGTATITVSDSTNAGKSNTAPVSVTVQ